VFELLDISAGYGDATVLSEVTVRVPLSSVVALLGPNGAGKTTLLRVASGLLRPRRGDIVCGGSRLTGRPAHEFVRHGVCHVPEGRGIFRSMTVRDNLLIQAPPETEGTAVERAIEVFPALGKRMGQLAGTLSGGEQQMLALTRAYVSNPTFVFLDEVSLGLAPIIVDEIFAFLRLLADKGAALLLVEQYVVRALHLADYVYVLNRGRVAFAGEPGELDEDQVFRTYVGAEV
jgi:branched-chain amino acid transport system ATP-binding protein